MLSRPSRALRIAAVVIILQYTLYFHFHFPTLTYITRILSPTTTASQSPCPNPHPYAQNITIAIKTGASEAQSRIPLLLNSSLRCVPPSNIHIFSDLSQPNLFPPYTLHDALSTISPTTTTNNPDFDLYFLQKQLWAQKGDLGELEGMMHPWYDTQLAAWVLDKYKNVHILEMVWEMQPGSDWYVFIDADTYIHHPSLVTWLSTLNPHLKTYIGSATYVGSDAFAHGGSGIILSRATMEAVLNNNDGMEKWDEKAREVCCGDLVLSYAVGEVGVGVQDVWPVIDGERPVTVPMGPGVDRGGYWCRPVVTFHHVTADDTRFLAEVEMERVRANKSGPLTHTELFLEYILPSLVEYRENWDNWASDTRNGGVEYHVETFEACAWFCEKVEECLQYSYHGQTCSMSTSVRAGVEKEADEKGMWRSGWKKDRIVEWAEKQPKCDTVEFPQQKKMVYPGYLGMKTP